MTATTLESRRIYKTNWARKRRERRYAMGLTSTGTPRKRKLWPELRGLTGKEYCRRRWRLAHPKNINGNRRRDYNIFPTVEELKSFCKISPDAGCWEWQRGKVAGYGYLRSCGRNILAHRASAIAHYGKIPDGLWVLHRCDNRACINPDHLFFGTSLDNVRDAISKDRHARGERMGCAKLTDERVLQILRFDRSKGNVPRILAARFNVTACTIQNVIAGRTWKHIPRKAATTL